MLQFGRYESPEENPFFPDSLPPLVVPPHNYPQILHPSGASININKTIWDIYFKQLLPLFVPKGDDGNYVPTAACDLQCLQVKLLVNSNVSSYVKLVCKPLISFYFSDISLLQHSDEHNLGFLG
ncbi:hypothetical protein CsSME_00037543 [Camellia sinensis var. sinensis]